MRPEETRWGLAYDYWHHGETLNIKIKFRSHCVKLNESKGTVRRTGYHGSICVAAEIDGAHGGR